MKQIKLEREHLNPKDCQLILVVTGTKQSVIAALEQALRDCRDGHGKPRQGIVSSFRGAAQVITPIWNGEEFK